MGGCTFCSSCSFQSILCGQSGTGRSLYTTDSSISSLRCATTWYGLIILLLHKHGPLKQFLSRRIWQQSPNPHEHFASSIRLFTVTASRLSIPPVQFHNTSFPYLSHLSASYLLATLGQTLYIYHLLPQSGKGGYQERGVTWDWDFVLYISYCRFHCPSPRGRL